MHRKVLNNRYKILKKIGSGAMGDVYKVKDLKNDSIVALKLLSKKKITSVAIQRFKREFRLLTELHHPNLCPVYDFGMLKGGRSYYTMQYIDGKNIFEAAKGLPYNKIYPLIVQLCRVLEYIHSKGLIHYDIKPGNILIEMMQGRRGETEKKSSMPRNTDSPILNAKLLDFGLVGEQRIKGGILIKGTLPYIAPEVIKGLAVDHRVDLFSLGVLLYEICTRKRLPIQYKQSLVTFLKQQERIVTTLPSKIGADIPKKLEKLTMRLLDFEPAARFNRANEVIKEINKITGLKFEFETEKTLEGYLLSSRFVGRDKEMGLLKSFYEKARLGECQVVLITGDAGIGKTRLLNEFRIFTQLRRGYNFTGYTHKEKIGPLEAFNDIFRELINYIDDKSKVKQSLAVLFKIYPDLTDGHLKKGLPSLVPLEPQAEKLRTLDALTELIKYVASNLGQINILLEDLHWADDLTIQFLEYLGRNISDRNIFICGSCRREELQGNKVLTRMMSTLKDVGCFTRIELRPLKFKSLYSILDSMITPDSNSSELARYLMKKTGGNPFFVEEIMRTLLRKKKVSIGENMEIKNLKQIAIPKTIEDVVLKRMMDLDQNSRKLVRFAAILLKDFTYDLMKRLTGLEDMELSKALWELKRKQILIEKDNTYQFYHTTLREAINKRMAYREKQQLHYKIGKSLELIYKKNVETLIEDLAYYFINAKDKKRGIKYGLQAAKKSSESYAHEQAIKFYKGVLGLLGNKNPKRRFDILQKLAFIEVVTGYYDDAIKDYNEALSLEIGTIDKKFKIYFGIGTTYEMRGKFIKAVQIYRKWMRLLKNKKSGRWKVLLETVTNATLCLAYIRIGDYKNANKFSFDNLQLSKNLKEREAIMLRGSVNRNLAVIEGSKSEYGKQNFDKAIYYFKEAYKYYKEINAKDRIATVLNDLGVFYYYKFDFQKALDYYQKATQISEKIGYQYGIVNGLYNLGNILKDKGCLLKASEYFRKALSVSKKFGIPLMTGASLYVFGECFLELCNYKQAREYLEKAIDIIDTIGWNYGKTYALRAIGDLYKAEGDYSLAFRFYRKSLKISRDIGHQGIIANSLLHISLLFIEIGEFLKAKKYIRDILKIAGVAIGTKRIEVRCYKHLCQINILLRDNVTAFRYYKKAINIAKKIGMKRELLQILLLLSCIYFNEEKYLKGINVANKSVKLAKDMGTKDLYVEALLMKIKNGIKQGVISRVEAFKIMKEAKEIAEEIGNPEILWQVYFEYGRNLQNNKEYIEALDYYQRCNKIFEDIIGKLKNKSYKRSYFNRPDRQAVLAAIDKIEKLLH